MGFNVIEIVYCLESVLIQNKKTTYIDIEGSNMASIDMRHIGFTRHIIAIKDVINRLLFVKKWNGK